MVTLHNTDKMYIVSLNIYVAQSRNGSKGNLPFRFYNYDACKKTCIKYGRHIAQNYAISGTIRRESYGYTNAKRAKIEKRKGQVNALILDNKSCM